MRNLPAAERRVAPEQLPIGHLETNHEHGRFRPERPASDPPRLQDVEQKLEQGPKRLQARKRILDQKLAGIESSKEQLKQFRMAADQKSLQLKTNEAKIADLKVKLNQATSNREFDIINSQIDADTMANSVLEDEILEALEKIDQMQATIGQAQAEYDAQQKDAERLTGEIAAAGARLEAQAEALSRSLKTAESVLPGNVMETYRRLVQAHGERALAVVANKACSACNEILSQQQQVQVRSSQFVFCRSCGRILYRDNA